MKFFGPLLILFIVLSCNKGKDNCAEHHLDACNTDEAKTNFKLVPSRHGLFGILFFGIVKIVLWMNPIGYHG